MTASFSLSPAYSFGFPQRTIWVAGLVSLFLHGLWLSGERDQSLEFAPLTGAKQALSVSLSHVTFSTVEKEPSTQKSPEVPVVESKAHEASMVKELPLEESPLASNKAAKEVAIEHQKVVSEAFKTEPKPQTIASPAAHPPADSTPEPIVQLEQRAEASPSDPLQSADNDSQVSALVRQNPSFTRPPSPPGYPPMAIKRRWQGTVILQALVRASGETSEIKIKQSSGFGLLDEAAVKAVRGWSFEPTIENGQTISSWVEVPVEFDLRSK